MKPGGRRRPDLYANIPLPVLQVPAGDEGGPGCLPYLLKEEEKEEEDDEEKKKDDDDEKEMKVKRREEADMQPGGGGGQDCQIPLVPFATCLFPLKFLLQGSFQQEEVKQAY